MIKVDRFSSDLCLKMVCNDAHYSKNKCLLTSASLVIARGASFPVNISRLSFSSTFHIPASLWYLYSTFLIWTVKKFWKTKATYQWCRRKGCRCTPKSVDLVKIQAKFLKIWAKSTEICENLCKIPKIWTNFL